MRKHTSDHDMLYFQVEVDSTEREQVFYDTRKLLTNENMARAFETAFRNHIAGKEPC